MPKWTIDKITLTLTSLQVSLRYYFNKNGVVIQIDRQTTLKHNASGQGCYTEENPVVGLIKHHQNNYYHAITEALFTERAAYLLVTPFIHHSLLTPAHVECRWRSLLLDENSPWSIDLLTKFCLIFSSKLIEIKMNSYEQWFCSRSNTNDLLICQQYFIAVTDLGVTPTYFCQPCRKPWDYTLSQKLMYMHVALGRKLHQAYKWTEIENL